MPSHETSSYVLTGVGPATIFLNVYTRLLAIYCVLFSRHLNRRDNVDTRLNINNRRHRTPTERINALLKTLTRRDTLTGLRILNRSNMLRLNSLARRYTKRRSKISGLHSLLSDRANGGGKVFRLTNGIATLHRSTILRLDRKDRMIEQRPIITKVGLPKQIERVRQRLKVRRIRVDLPRTIGNTCVLPMTLRTVNVRFFAHVRRNKRRVLAGIVKKNDVLFVHGGMLTRFIPDRSVGARENRHTLERDQLLIRLMGKTIEINIRSTRTTNLLLERVRRDSNTINALLLVDNRRLTMIRLMSVIAKRRRRVLKIVPLGRISILVGNINNTLMPIDTNVTLVKKRRVSAYTRTIRVPKLAKTGMVVRLRELVLNGRARYLCTKISAIKRKGISSTVLATMKRDKLNSAPDRNMRTTALTSNRRRDRAFLFAGRSEFLLYFRLGMWTVGTRQTLEIA